MKTLTLNIPDSIEIESNDILMIVATKLYEQSKLTLGQAAELAGLDKIEFAEKLSNYGVSIINH